MASPRCGSWGDREAGARVEAFPTLEGPLPGVHSWVGSEGAALSKFLPAFMALGSPVWTLMTN